MFFSASNSFFDIDIYYHLFSLLIFHQKSAKKYPEIFDSFKNFRISVDLAGVEPASESHPFEHLPSQSLY